MSTSLAIQGAIRAHYTQRHAAKLLARDGGITFQGAKKLLHRAVTPRSDTLIALCRKNEALRLEIIKLMEGE